MNNNSRLRYFIYLSILIVGCTTGKNALQKGDYDASLIKAVNRLQNSPNNAEAIAVLNSAYTFSLQNHKQKIEEAKLSNNVLRWEVALQEYQRLNQLSDEINKCPSCLKVVPNPQRYSREIEEYKYKSAEVRYATGINLMNENTRESAKKAYADFEKANYFYPNFKDVRDRLDEAYRAAVLNVVVSPALVRDSYYRLSADYFQQQVDAYLQNYRRNKFVALYTEQEAIQNKITADQVINLDFEDFRVGDTYVKERVERLKRDSVLVGQTRNRPPQPIYGTVKAVLSIFEKQVSSGGRLTVTITDRNTNKVVRQKRLSGTYVWQDSWASYKGDERALTKEQLNWSKRKEIMPPPPDELFIQFTKPIYEQLVREVDYFYANY